MPTHPLADILAAHPDLTAYGFEKETDPAEFEDRVRELGNSRAAFDEVCVWIREHLSPTPCSRGYYSSYR